MLAVWQVNYQVTENRRGITGKITGKITSIGNYRAIGEVYKKIMLIGPPGALLHGATTKIRELLGTVQTGPAPVAKILKKSFHYPGVPWVRRDRRLPAHRSSARARPWAPVRLARVAGLRSDP